MTLRTFSENVKVAETFLPADLTNGTQDGDYVDTQAFGGPYRRAALIVMLAPGSATTGNFTLEESATGSGSGSTVSGATLSSAIGASTSATAVCNINLAKRLRYLRVNIVGTGTNGTAAALFALFEGEYLAPLADSAVKVVTV